MTRQILALLMCVALLCTLPQTAGAQALVQPDRAGVVISNTPHRQGAAAKQQPRPVPQRTEQTATQKSAPDNKITKKNSVKKAAVKTSKTTAVSKKVNVQQSNWRLKVAQQKLQVLGFSEEKPNGKMTVATTEALKRFQKQYKLKAHGELDDTTYRKLTWEAFSKEGIKNVEGKEIVNKAAKYKGVPYVFGGTTPKGFDCSGYVQYVFKNCKAALPRLADEQALEGVFVTQKQLRPGDLVFFTTYTAGASHVGIYAGSGQFWSASSSKGVMLSSLKDEYWKNRYYGARRVLVANGEA